MRVFIMLGGYILVPLLVALLFRLFRIKWVFITYLITSILIYFYPDFQLAMTFYLASPEEVIALQNRVCGTGDAMLWFANLVCFLPATLMIQLLFTYLFTNAFFIKKEPLSSNPQKSAK